MQTDSPRQTDRQTARTVRQTARTVRQTARTFRQTEKQRDRERDEVEPGSRRKMSKKGINK